MEALETILSRRSVRQFEPEPVDTKIIEKILYAAMSAPSATNEQPWQFLVIDKKEILDAIPTVHPYSKMLHEAPLAIIPCIEETKNYKDYWALDMAAATENLLLAVHALGLGAVWVGVYPNEERVTSLQKLLQLPTNVIPFAIIPVGHTTVKQKPLPERLQKNRIHYNKW